jgi:hypothetical protein
MKIALDPDRQPVAKPIVVPERIRAFDSHESIIEMRRTSAQVIRNALGKCRMNVVSGVQMPIGA